MKHKVWFNEKTLFYVVLVLNLFPIFCGNFFQTLDGPAHLYNSQLINSLFFGNGGTINDYFMLNSEVVPNWSGHFILALFNYFLPAYVAEKIVLIFCLIGLPVAFRALVKTISPQNHFLSFLIFPFTYSFMLFLGFYNFSIGVVMALVVLNFWLKYESEQLSFKRYFVLTFLFLVCYFSHIFAFGMLIFILGIYLFLTSLLGCVNTQNSLKTKSIVFLKKARRLALTAFVPLLLFLFYFITRAGEKNYTFLDKKELVKWVFDIRSIIALSFSKEENFTYPIFIILMLLLLVTLYLRIKNRKYRFEKSDVWLIVSVALLVLYFFMPDSNGAAGYISVRLQFLFFVFLVLWLTAQKLPIKIGYTAVFLVLTANFLLNIYYFGESKKHNAIAMECYETAKYIPSNSIVLPINHSGNWLMGHVSNYLGAEKPMVILENYECGTKYFPILWNEKAAPKTMLGNKMQSEIPCIWWLSNANNQPQKIDYVFMLKNKEAKKDTCNSLINKTLKRNYKLIRQTRLTELYQLK